MFRGRAYKCLAQGAWIMTWILTGYNSRAPCRKKMRSRMFRSVWMILTSVWMIFRRISPKAGTTAPHTRCTTCTTCTTCSHKKVTTCTTCQAGTTAPITTCTTCTTYHSTIVGEEGFSNPLTLRPRSNPQIPRTAPGSKLCLNVASIDPTHHQVLAVV